MDVKLGAERIRQLINIKKAIVKGLSVNRMLIELSLDTSIVDNMKKGHMPSADKLVTIAQYLDTSVAYIIGMSDEEKPTTPDKRQSVDVRSLQIVQRIINLPAQDMEKALKYLDEIEHQDTPQKQ